MEAVALGEVDHRIAVAGAEPVGPGFAVLANDKNQWFGVDRTQLEDQMVQEGRQIAAGKADSVEQEGSIVVARVVEDILHKSAGQDDSPEALAEWSMERQPRSGQGVAGHTHKGSHPGVGKTGQRSHHRNRALVSAGPISMT
ncbi:hypothetical protein ABW19_dt0203636 [Dactylella cylindrospora]|nr:hypothetical protein ABW19_dt0203636 [Dactylella cylindrospora]